MPIPPEQLARARDGDREALIELLTERYPCLYRMAYALSGREDAAAGVVRQVLRQSVPASRRWNSPADVLRWFIHHSLLTLRRVQVRATDLAHDPLIRSSNSGNSAYYPMFIQAIRALPMQQREAFMLYHGERLDERGIGVAMDCSMQAAALHLREATRVMAAYGGNLFSTLTEQFVQTYRSPRPAGGHDSAGDSNRSAATQFLGMGQTGISAHDSMDNFAADRVAAVENYSNAAMVVLR